MIRLGMFAKYWQPGEVKTRLAISLGEVTAAELYRAFLECLLERFSEFGDERRLAITPAEKTPEFEMSAGSDWRVVLQVSGDLGTRMRTFFEQFRDESPDADDVCLLIGSDAPTVPLEYIEQSVELLHRQSLAIGPCEDGGYYLIGIRRDAILPQVLDALFTEMPWSEPTLLRQTVARLDKRGIDHRLLPPWYDVDERTDLDRLKRDLATASEPTLLRLRRMVEEVLQQ